MNSIDKKVHCPDKSLLYMNSQVSSLYSAVRNVSKNERGHR